MTKESIPSRDTQLTAELEQLWGKTRRVDGYTLPDPESETWRCNVDFTRTSPREVLLILLHRMHFVQESDPCIPNEGIIVNLDGALGWESVIAQGRLCRRPVSSD